MEAIGKLVERSEKPTSNGNIRYSLKFQQTEGLRTYSGFKQNRDNIDFGSLEYGQWYWIAYYETDNPQGSYPFKNISAIEPTEAPATAGSISSETYDIRRSKERTSLENCLIAASHLASVGDTTDLWIAALELYTSLDDWEAGVKSDKAEQATEQTTEPDITDFGDAASQYQEKTSAPHCQRHDKSMFRITGSDRVGHPYTTEDGERAMCYGESV